ncbi:MAG TPA: hypothetical protein VGT60_05905 [Candidatus Limnocylindria bacterium]|nr:hypothetical protein [Candidatus Limnocylindria bacterium]
MARRKRVPLISSVQALRGIAVGITMLSLAGMTAYAGGHPYNTGAPLQPQQPVAAPAAAPATTTTTTGRLQLSRGITTTTTRPVTITRRS